MSNQSKGELLSPWECKIRNKVCSEELAGGIEYKRCLDPDPIFLTAQGQSKLLSEANFHSGCVSQNKVEGVPPTSVVGRGMWSMAA